MVKLDEKCVYLDWAATAPLSREAWDAMEPFLVPGLGNLSFGCNANSLHSCGRRAFSALEVARASIARSVGAARADEIIFTSGATEANNTLLEGIVSASKKRAMQSGKQRFVPHIITSAIEHDAVLAPVRRLKAQGCEVSYLQVNRQGFVEAHTLEASLKENTVLVSIQTANNEIGSVQAIRQLADITHQGAALFHSDAAQALGKIPFDVNALGLDAASFSAHKIGGPKGVGAFYLKGGTVFDPLLVGGGQESGKRSGTQNVCAAVGFAAACESACAMQKQEALRLQGLRDYLYKRLQSFNKVMPTVKVEQKSSDYLPNIVNVCVDGLESETMILRFDMQGFAVSGGSACSSQSLEPSHVLRALGLPKDQAYGSLRISFGRYTTEPHIEDFLRAFEACLAQEKGMLWS